MAAPEAEYEDFMQGDDSEHEPIWAVDVNLRLIKVCGELVVVTGKIYICYGASEARLGSVCLDIAKYDICIIGKTLIFSETVEKGSAF